MSKYILRVIKIRELDKTTGILSSGKHMLDNINEEYPLFQGEMDSDQTIEILDHAYKLKLRQK